MLYMFCMCGNLLGHRQKFYQKRMIEIQQKYDMNQLSELEYEDAKKHLMNVELGELEYCCKMRIATFVDIVQIVN
jgi:DNA-directed RNA polymerase subunit N (RpoN/RPB10)